jgi:hypothetical protein
MKHLKYPIEEIEAQILADCQNCKKTVSRSRRKPYDSDDASCCPLEAVWVVNSGYGALSSFAEFKFGMSSQDAWSLMAGFDDRNWPLANKGNPFYAMGQRLAEKYP